MSLYSLETERVIQEIKKLGAEVVGLQFPDGLRIRATEVAERIEKETGSLVLV